MANKVERESNSTPLTKKQKAVSIAKSRINLLKQKMVVFCE